MRILAIITVFLFGFSALNATEIQRYTFSPPVDLTKAEIDVEPTVMEPRGVLILCPGCNSGAESWIAAPEWRQFAMREKLALAGVTFVSDVKLLTESQRGYYYASQGSGDLLLRAIRKIYGRDLPILIFGFSGGAHFASSFVEWEPERVITWCACSAGWWNAPRPMPHSPPGIVACGDDDVRYGATLTYFLQGRALGRPWTLVLVSNSFGHQVRVPI